MTEIISAIVGAFLGSLFTWLFDHSRRKKSEEKQRRAEDELAEIRRRANAPFLTPSDTRFEGVLESQEGGEISHWSAGNGNVLCFYRNEIPKDAPSGTSVIFVVENGGDAARRVSVTLDGERISLKQEPDIEFAGGQVQQFVAFHFLRPISKVLLRSIKARQGTGFKAQF